MAKLTRVVIDRAKWGKQALLNTKGKMCCLGFCAKSAGVPPAAMKGASMPNDPKLKAYKGMLWAKFPGLLVEDELDHNYAMNSDTACELATINDDMINGPKKEAKIKAEGLKAGIQFVFTGSYV